MTLPQVAYAVQRLVRYPSVDLDLLAATIARRLSRNEQTRAEKWRKRGT